MGASTGDRRVAWPHGSVAARVLIGLVVAVAAGSNACSGDDDTAPTEPVETPGPTSIAATTVVPTTPPPTTTEPETVAPSSHVPDTTMAAPAPSSAPGSAAAPLTDSQTTASATEETAALAAVAGAYNVWRECIRNLPTCDTSKFAEFEIDPQLSGDQSLIAEWRSNSFEAKDVDLYTFHVIEVRLDASVPYVLVCQQDGSSLVERLPGQPERVVEEGYTEKIREVQLTLTADGWRVHGFATREEAAGEVGALCA